MTADRRDFAKPMTQSVDVVRSERAQQPAAFRLGGHPCERSRLWRHVAIEEELDRAELEGADVAVVQQFFDICALRRMAKLVTDHCRPATVQGGVAHFRRLLRVERKRLFAED